jgi:hypothetical protein
MHLLCDQAAMSFFLESGLEYMEATAIFFTMLFGDTCLGVSSAQVTSTPSGILVDHLYQCAGTH